MKRRISPRGDFHPLLATEEQPVGGSGLGPFSISMTINYSYYNDNVSLQYTIGRLIIYITFVLAYLRIYSIKCIFYFMDNVFRTSPHSDAGTLKCTDLLKSSAAAT